MSSQYIVDMIYKIFNILPILVIICLFLGISIIAPDYRACIIFFQNDNITTRRVCRIIEKKKTKQKRKEKKKTTIQKKRTKHSTVGPVQNPIKKSFLCNVKEDS